MSDIFAARPQITMSLVSHVIFAAVGVALPLMMVIAEAAKALLERTFPRLYRQVKRGELSFMNCVHLVVVQPAFRRQGVASDPHFIIEKAG
jgi:hypothetical protein